jgi:hypothetical protein
MGVENHAAALAMPHAVITESSPDRDFEHYTNVVIT